MDPDKRAAIVADIRSGQYGRNEIARRNDVGMATVTRVAETEGLGTTAWDRSATKQATAAKVADAAVGRSSLAHKSLDVAAAMLQRLGELAAEAKDVKDVAIAYGIATDKHLQLARFDSDDGASEATSLVRGLRDAFGVAYEQMTGGGGDRPPEGPVAGESEATSVDR